MATAAKKRPSRAKPAGSSGSSSSSSTPAPKKYDDWPKKGDTRAQPWDRGPDDEPVPLSHGRPVLTSGSADPSVVDLCQRLAKLGYETSVSKGQNALGVVDEGVLKAVQQFRRDYGVQEDPSGFLDETTAANHIGPWTWEAVLRASDREE